MAQKTVLVHSRADVVFTQGPDGGLRGWMVVGGGEFVELDRQQFAVALEGAPARALLADELDAPATKARAK